MSTNRTPLERPRRLSLSREENESLQYGDLPGRPGFASDEERKAAWFHHRDELLMHCSGGQRPAGWWDYESPVPRPCDRDYDAATLYEAGLLTESEISELMTHWRQAFERAQDPRFMVCLGFVKPDDATATWLAGAPARERHYRWSGIPKGLVREWTAEHRRRSKRIRKLETAAAHPAA